jgi:hypothetical protein
MKITRSPDFEGKRRVSQRPAGAAFEKRHDGIVPLFCPTRQMEFAKYEIEIGLEL